MSPAGDVLPSGPMNTLPRRKFLTLATRGALAGAAWGRVPLSARAEGGPPAPPVSVGDDPVPVRLSVPLPRRWRAIASEGRLCWRATPSGDAEAASFPVQLLPDDGDRPPRLVALLPRQLARTQSGRWEAAPRPAPADLQARRNPATGQFELTDRRRPVLRYNYAVVKPSPALLRAVAPGNRIYAVARSDYVHPLHGLNGEILTRDWSPDHPHHRGIYWAWPEVDWHGRRGDLHALQHVFARPTGRCVVTGGPWCAQVDAENLWHWENGPPIVRERALIRAWRATPAGRRVDLRFQFTALGEPVWLARRKTHLYGGLNLRLSRVRDQRIVKHADPRGSRPRRSWGEVSGVFAAASRPSGLVILPHAANPDYPGDWVDYPDLNWLQPTFPAAHTRHRLTPERPLTLRYRLWIHPGPAAEPAACAAQWQAANAPFSPLA